MEQYATALQQHCLLSVIKLNKKKDTFLFEKFQLGCILRATVFLLAKYSKKQNDFYHFSTLKLNLYIHKLKIQRENFFYQV